MPNEVVLTNAAEASKLEIPNMRNTSLAKLFDMAHELRNYTEKNAVFRIPNIQSPLDIATLIWEKIEFLITTK